MADNDNRHLDEAARARIDQEKSRIVDYLSKKYGVDQHALVSDPVFIRLIERLVARAQAEGVRALHGYLDATISLVEGVLEHGKREG